MRSLSHNRSSYFRFTQVRYAGRFVCGIGLPG